MLSPTIHCILKPILISPIGDETFSGDVSISWSLSLDPWDYAVIYSVSYSMDEGILWNFIVDDLTGTSLTWDSTTVPDGDSYLIKVEAVSVGGLYVYSITASPFTIDNVPPTTTATTTTTIPSWSIILLLLALLILVPYNHRRK